MSDQCRNCVIRGTDIERCNSEEAPCSIPESWYVKQLLAALKAERDDLRERLVSVREHRMVDATPNEELPIRVLSAYIETDIATDNTLGLPPENPLCKIINEAQWKRNAILRAALNRLTEEGRD